MSKPRIPLTQERLRELLHYDEETGVFTRLVRVAQRSRVGDIAGGIAYIKKWHYRRIMISVDGVRYRAHRVAWLYVYGVWPNINMEIDHIDGDGTNNAIRNLRCVSHKVNSQNFHHALAGNTAGLLGVHYAKRERKFIAKIGVDGRYIYLGTFETPEEAHEAYIKAKRKYHEGNTL
jgi:hypothetical protein